MKIYSPLRLREYLIELQAKFNQIKYVSVLVRYDHIANIVKESLYNDEIAVIGFLPDVKSRGKDLDALMFSNQMGFVVIEKTDYSEKPETEEYIQIFERTAQLVDLIIEQMIQDATDEKWCDLFNYLSPDSLIIRPVIHEAHCNGWEFEFNIDLPN